MKKQTKIELMLDKILSNQQIIYDYLQLIIYNQSPDAKRRYVVMPNTLIKIQRKYGIW